MTARFSEVGAPATTGLPSGSLSSRNAAAVNNHVNNTRSNPSAGALAAVWGTRSGAPPLVNAVPCTSPPRPASTYTWSAGSPAAFLEAELMAGYYRSRNGRGAPGPPDRLLPLLRPETSMPRFRTSYNPVTHQPALGTGLQWGKRLPVHTLEGRQQEALRLQEAGGDGAAAAGAYRGRMPSASLPGRTGAQREQEEHWSSVRQAMAPPGWGELQAGEPKLSSSYRLASEIRWDRKKQLHAKLEAATTTKDSIGRGGWDRTYFRQAGAKPDLIAAMHRAKSMATA